MVRSPFTLFSGRGWSSPKSKSRYDRRSVSQYVLVPSPRGFRRAPKEFQSDIKATFLKLSFGGLHIKHCSATWNLGTNSEFALGPRKRVTSYTTWSRTKYKSSLPISLCLHVTNGMRSGNHGGIRFLATDVYVTTIAAVLTTLYQT
jgi:hypothetical protein